MRRARLPPLLRHHRLEGPRAEGVATARLRLDRRCPHDALHALTNRSLKREALTTDLAPTEVSFDLYQARTPR
jgi:hypothetical protein